MSLHTRTSRAGLRILMAALFLSLLALATVVAQTQPAASPAAPAAANNQTAPAAPNAAPPTATPTPPYQITVGEVKRYGDAAGSAGGKVVAGLDDEIVVKVNNLREELERQTKEDEARQAQGQEPAPLRLDPSKLVLFLDDVQMKKVYPQAVILESNEVRFKLERTEETREAWNNLLAKPEGPERPNVKVGVGPEGMTSWPLARNVAQNFNLRIYDRVWLRWVAVLFGLLLVLFVWLARVSNIIRDSLPPEPLPGKNKPFSLARTQVAWWLFIILGSFGFIGLVTWDYNTITASSLVLLGIGSVTALSSAMLDANKNESAASDLRTLKPRQIKLESQVAELRGQVTDVEAKSSAVPPTVTPQELALLGAARTELASREAELEQLNVQVADAESARNKPVSEGFIKDILSDVNGVTLHRFQMVVWTVVLGIIFVWTVWTSLQMPEFNQITLALMGISAGTYLGFKIPERHTEPGDDGDGDGGVGGGAATPTSPTPLPPGAPPATQLPAAPPPPPPPPPGGEVAGAVTEAATAGASETGAEAGAAEAGTGVNVEGGAAAAEGGETASTNNVEEGGADENAQGGEVAEGTAVEADVAAAEEAMGEDVEAGADEEEADRT